jgi:hypothetical protein
MNKSVNWEFGPRPRTARLLSRIHTSRAPVRPGARLRRLGRLCSMKLWRPWKDPSNVTEKRLWIGLGPYTKQDRE